MGPQQYQRVAPDDEHDRVAAHSPSSTFSPSPPPSFHSRTPSPSRQHNRSDPERQRLVSNADRELADTFDSPSDDESDNGSASHVLDDRQRVMSGRPSGQPMSPPSNNGDDGDAHGRPRPVERRVTQLPAFAPATTNKVYGANNAVHDGVFANLSAKPERGEEVDEKPPTYEQAAADATPPYWETTILTPGGTTSDDVFIDGLPVGSFFSFVWNGMISMSFQLVGFLLTYLLHTTHAAKNGSKAGLGITLIQYGFSMKRDFGFGRSTPNTGGDPGGGDAPPGGNPDNFVPPPGDPNNHDFDPNKAAGDASFVQNAAAHAASGMKATDWFAYALMLVGWFILIRAISEYFKARRHESLVLQSPSRGLNIPVVAEGERPENAV